ncbi:TPA: hypothetical protein N0F65_004817 [Lagenidium giganteum]|uniref:Uncharacterized protein n=1 Tax=Lagenidium giganteum TaxID=4803 RepID=A0AAV2Z666_9STRA|nr:TPA: hypothetical protein N0F65_004817 [Lagenidium giganteum]
MSRRKYDVASIVRVRDCGRRGDDNACLTIAVDDSRYEGCVFASNAIDWFPIVSSLRWFGQTYLHLRIALLLVGCYVARAQEPAYARASICSKLQTTWHLFVRLPSSSLVYGSSIPIVCYALAQVIDASLTYEIIAQHFAQKMGMFTFDARVFFPLAATQMRNVWCLALVVHSVLHWLVVCRSNWSPSQGIPGLPGMFLASAASVSLFTQFRALSLRDAKILTVQLAQREDRQPFASARFVTDHHGPGNMLLEGVVLDLKVFLCLFVSIAMFLGTAHAWLEWRQAYGCRRHSPFSLLVMRSAVPYSAGSLWPAVALSIRWNDSVFSNVLVARRLGPGAELLPKIKVSDTVVTMDDNDGNDSASQRLVLGDSARTRRTQSKFLLHHMEHVHSRCDEVDVVVVLLNLVAMTDPLTLIRLRWIGGYRIQYFEFMPTGRVIILPQQVMRAKANINLPWPQLSYLGEVDSRALQWADLLHCG